MTGPNFIWGCGGHASVIGSLLRSLGETLEGFLVEERMDDSKHLGTSLYFADELSSELLSNANIYLGVGDNWKRQELADRIRKRFPAIRFPALVHPDAFVDPSVSVGPGSMVFAQATVGPNVKIGNFVIINHGAIVDHDSVVDHGSSIAPGAVIGGSVRIGCYSAVSMGALVRNGLTVGDHSVVGMGSVVTRSVDHNYLVYGSPARVIRRRAIGETYL